MTLPQFFNAQDAWIAIGPANQQEGAGIAVLRTTDGGISWLRSRIDDPLVSRVDVPHFLNVQQGWLELSSTPGAGSAKADIWTNAQTGWGVTSDQLLQTTDGGKTWQRTPYTIQ